MKKSVEEVIKEIRIVCHPIFIKGSVIRPCTEKDIEFVHIDPLTKEETILEKGDPRLEGIDTIPTGFVRVGLDNSNLDEAILASNKIISNSGYDLEEYQSLQKEYFCDFSSDNPDEWIIRHDPENAEVIYPNV